MFPPGDGALPLQQARKPVGVRLWWNTMMKRVSSCWGWRHWCFRPNMRSILSDSVSLPVFGNPFARFFWSDQPRQPRVRTIRMINKFLLTHHEQHGIYLFGSNYWLLSPLIDCLDYGRHSNQQIFITGNDHELIIDQMFQLIELIFLAFCKQHSK